MLQVKNVVETLQHLDIVSGQKSFVFFKFYMIMFWDQKVVNLENNFCTKIVKVEKIDSQLFFLQHLSIFLHLHQITTLRRYLGDFENVLLS